MYIVLSVNQKPVSKLNKRVTTKVIKYLNVKRCCIFFAPQLGQNFFGSASECPQFLQFILLSIIQGLLLLSFLYNWFLGLYISHPHLQFPLSFRVALPKVGHSCILQQLNHER